MQKEEKPWQKYNKVNENDTNKRWNANTWQKCEKKTKPNKAK